MKNKKDNKKKGKTPAYQVTWEQIETYIKHGYERGVKASIQRATDLSLTIPAMVLRDEFGFGGKRIEKFMEAVRELYDSVDKGYINLNEVDEAIRDETGVQIVRRN